MFKFKVLFFVFIFFALSASATVLKGGVKYDVDSARAASFENVQYKIDISQYEEYLFDKDFEKHKKKGVISFFKNRGKFITIFSDGEYCISYSNMRNPDFYYDEKGNLYSLGFTEYKRGYPKRYLYYDTKGNLENIAFNVSPRETYIFNLDKTLLFHWIGSNGYDEKGELTFTRYSFL